MSNYNTSVQHFHPLHIVYNCIAEAHRKRYTDVTAQIIILFGTRFKLHSDAKGMEVRVHRLAFTHFGHNIRGGRADSPLSEDKHMPRHPSGAGIEYQ